MKKLLFVMLLCPLLAVGQSVEGKWKTIDDETGKARSVVEIEERGGKIVGTVVEILDKDKADPICENCSGKKKNQKIIGMEIISDMVYDEDEKAYVDGEILDPESGKVYDCKIWTEGEELKVRGYVAFFYRTQTWLPYK